MDLLVELRRQLSVLDLPVSETAMGRLIWLQTELLRWNRTHNLTAITDPREALEKHLVDSLTLLPYLPDTGRILDIGSGGGFPGLPVSIVRPELDVVSVDAVEKKIAFQRHASRRLGLTGFHPWHGRIEKLAAESLSAGGFDLIVARAFTSLSGFVEMALPYLGEGGRLIAMKGPEGERELLEAGNWLSERAVVCEQRVVLQLPVSKARRCLLILSQKHKILQ
jgi:16S rRNA (guanine527-N7)-methyltransferase